MRKASETETSIILGIITRDARYESTAKSVVEGCFMCIEDIPEICDDAGQKPRPLKAPLDRQTAILRHHRGRDDADKQ